MSLDLAHRHAARVERQDLVVETRPAGLVFGNEPRLEAAVPVPRHFNRQFAKLALQRLLALAVAGITGGIRHRFMLPVAEMFGQPQAPAPRPSTLPSDAYGEADSAGHPDSMHSLATTVIDPRWAAEAVSSMTIQAGQSDEFDVGNGSDTNRCCVCYKFNTV